jgi:hypothetical protein
MREHWFMSDDELGKLLLGDKRAKEWPSIAKLLEMHGLPKVDLRLGGRYVPAVKAFFDNEYGLDGIKAPLAVDGIERLGSWKKQKSKA